MTVGRQAQGDGGEGAEAGESEATCDSDEEEEEEEGDGDGFYSKKSPAVMERCKQVTARFSSVELTNTSRWQRSMRTMH